MSALTDLVKRFPETVSSETIVGFFLNGEAELWEDRGTFLRLIEKVNTCSHLLLVDGGANHFLRLTEKCLDQNILLLPKVCALIGDLDSVAESSLKLFRSLFSHADIIQLDRDKDFTDFEAAIQITKIQDIKAAYLFSALGGRIDHELTILKFLHRKSLGKKVSVFHPKNGCLHIVSEKQTPLDFPLFSGGYLRLEPFSSDENSLQAKLTNICALIKKPYPHKETLSSHEELFVVSGGQSISFPTEIAQTLSFIPLGGHAKNVQTKGLCWELNIERFGKKICGVSNIAKKNIISISVGDGYVLCVKTRFIDQDMYLRVQKK